ncbi:MAG: hypothetical protein JXQ73_25365 [Phycisphaerae bacterium]|nr:hypothetical protein [Phycisphaerae bacterium]
MRLLLKGETSPIPQLVLELSKTSDDEADAEITFTTWSGSFRFSFALYGWNLARFADELQRIRERMEGTARLTNFGENIELTFTVAQPARGIVLVAGKIADGQWLKDDAPGHPDVARFEAGFQTRFGWLVIDQSYLPEIVREITGFIVDNKLSTQHPMR